MNTFRIKLPPDFRYRTPAHAAADAARIVSALGDKGDRVAIFGTDDNLLYAYAAIPDSFGTLRGVKIRPDVVRGADFIDVDPKRRPEEQRREVLARMRKRTRPGA